MPNMTTEMVRNNAGGLGFAVDDWKRLRRFLILGVETSIYAPRGGHSDFSLTNEAAVLRLLQRGEGAAVVRELTECSLAGRAAKQEPLLFCLAVCCRHGDEATRAAAYAAVADICRIPTHLFAFVGFCEKVNPGSTGWGRGMRRAVGLWYLGKAPSSLAFAATKYRNRVGWTHCDLLRLAHCKPGKAPQARHRPASQLVLHYLVKGPVALAADASEPAQPAEEGVPAVDPADAAAAAAELAKCAELLRAVELLRCMNTPEKLDVRTVVDLAHRHRLAHEHLPNLSLHAVEVWAALLGNMPLQATLRNLNRMTKVGLFADKGARDTVVARLNDADLICASRLHPYHILTALRMYERGRGERGGLVWEPVPDVAKALDNAFYLSFGAVQPTGQRVLVALDVSGSMSTPVLDSTFLSCRDASVALAMVTARTEPECHALAFSGRLVQLRDYGVDLRASELAVNVERSSQIPFGNTDCSLPMLWALENHVDVDTFIVYTDSETWAGRVQPVEALRQYREQRRRPHARLIVVGLSSNGFSIADPTDPGMLDVVGFDTGAPEVMRAFMMGEI